MTIGSFGYRTINSKMSLRAYIHARNAFMRCNAEQLSDGSHAIAFAAGPRNVLP